MPDVRAEERERLKAMLLKLPVMPISRADREAAACCTGYHSLDEAVLGLDKELVQWGETTGDLRFEGTSIFSPPQGLAYARLWRTGENQWEHLAFYRDES
jgi:hypothetical protein